MRIWTIIVVAGLAGLSLLAFWRVHALSSRELRVLGLQMDALAADWEARRVPMFRRVVSVILSDADSGPDPFTVAPPAGGLWETAGGWISRSLIGGEPALQTPTPFARSVADSTSLVWCHEGFSNFSEEAMARDIAAVIIKAHDAGAELNIVAQGISAAPVLTALKGVDGTERAGMKVGANKVVLVGMDRPTLKRIPSIAAYDFDKPGSVLELANIWVPPYEVARNARMEISGAGKSVEGFNLGDVWPDLVGNASTADKLAEFIRRSVAAKESFGELLARQEQALREAEARRNAEAAALQEAQARAAAQREADLRAGAQREAEAQAAAEREAQRQRAAALSARASENQKACAQCCAAAGGSWRYGEDSFGGDNSGCCEGAGWPSNSEDLPACSDRIASGRGKPYACAAQKVRERWFRCKSR